jgi:hypothetical protein
MIKIFVGYRTKPVDDETLRQFMPVLVPDGRFTDEAKIAADLDKKRLAFLAKAKNQPYTGTLESVALNIPELKHLSEYHTSAKGPSVAARVGRFLLKEFPDGWSDDISPNARPAGAMFLGFNPRTFLKMLGMECSLLQTGLVLPARMWFHNTDHRDILEAVVPSECQIDSMQAIKAHRPKDKEGAEKWDELLKGWTGPGENAMTDATLACKLAMQLGLMTEK